MKFNLLFLFFILFLARINSFQLADNDAFASRVVARIHRMDQDRASLLANGVFINSRSILTTASSIQNLTMAQLRIEFGNTNLIGSRVVRPESVVVHPDFNMNNLLENNIAVLRLSVADGNSTAPHITNTDVGRLVRGRHFCSMFGYAGIFSDEWQGIEPMHMIPSMIENNSTACNHLFRGEFTCTFGNPHIAAFCGGFMGSPIICDGSRVSGIVTRDNYCGERPTAYVTDLDGHGEWIRRASGSGIVLASTILTFIGFLMSKMV